LKVQIKIFVYEAISWFNLLQIVSLNFAIIWSISWFDWCL